MIIASGRSNTHVAAIADRVAKALKTPGGPPPRIEGMDSAEWVLIDAGSAIVHIFRPEIRLFYSLEKLWGEGRPDEGNASPPVKAAPRAKPAADAAARRPRAKTARRPQ